MIFLNAYFWTKSMKTLLNYEFLIDIKKINKYMNELMNKLLNFCFKL